MAMVTVFLSPMVDQLTGFGQVYTLTMIQHLFSSYRAIDEINLKQNAVKIMGIYNTIRKGVRILASRRTDHL